MTDMLQLNTTNDTDANGNTVMNLEDLGFQSAIRFKCFPEGVRISEIDVVKAVCKKDNDGAGKVLRRLTENQPDTMSEIHNNSIVSKFFGRGQVETTLITFKGVLKLVMQLPGVNAREIRDQFATVLQRYFAGDPALVAELIDNNSSDAPINALAREDAGVPQIISEERIKQIYDDMHKQHLVHFELHRKRKLYDDRVAESRREKEHMRRIQEIQIERDSVVASEEAKQKTFHVEVSSLKEKLELTKQIKEIGTIPVIQVVPPTATGVTEALYTEPKFDGIVTVSRVADYTLPVDTLSEAFRTKVLLRAGRIATRTLPAERNKVIGLFGYMENWYNSKWFDNMEAIVKQAYKEEKRLLNPALV